MIELNSLQKYYNRKKHNEVHALRGIDLQINQGELVAIMGKSGAGKSTLLHILGFIDDFDGGEFNFEGENVSNLRDGELAKIRNQKIGIILQDYALIPELTVLEDVMTTLYFSKLSLRMCKQKALDALEQDGIVELARKNVNELSGPILSSRIKAKQASNKVKD